MRDLTIGSKQIRVKAGALALLFYKQEFKSDLLGDMLKMVGGNVGGGPNVEIDPSSIDFLGNLQMVWAMAKSAAYPNPYDGFSTWLAALDDDLDFSDTTFFVEALEEATEGFFRQQSNGIKGGVPANQ
ncbi:hypothetical protein QNH38_22445 [Paenibacillus polymyxa]|uniref:hypothetical protein n=1 Tax=Paenibacillus polymyxa TaxID=1406 RepID=UPI0024BF5E7E|nr:hypothetical protein [Paenibacillus polymyxa]WHX35267.1 hypothetical protein QNH38_22445 [Paenibacillus polymyxa]